MRKYECIVCGWVYDEAVGEPGSGIPAGTRWEDVPEDFLCPDCGVSKEDFELLEEDTLPKTDEQTTNPADVDEVLPVVIIGTGMSGYSTAKEFRKHDSDTPLLMMSASDGRAYSKPMLSTGFTRKVEADALATASAAEMGTQLNMKVMTDAQVVAIDAQTHTVSLDGGEMIRYAALVLAQGSEVIEPPLEGNALDRVYAVNDLQDYARFRSALRDGDVKKVVIIGAGLIGSEFANDLLNGGYEIEAVDPLAHVLPTLLPAEAGKAVQAALEENGVRYHFGTVAKTINRADNGQGLVVKMANGVEVHTDIVVSAVGVRPCVALAKRSGIKTERGIVANRLLETSAKDVYTLGDCAEVEGLVLYYVAPLTACARALGRTLSGTPTEVVYPAMPITIKVPCCPVVVSPPPKNAQGAWQIEKDGHDVCGEFRNNEGKLLGFALTGKRISDKIRLQKELPPVLS